VLRLSGGKAMVTYVELHLRGHTQYYGMSGNMQSLHSYCHHALKQLWKWLNRRSQRRSISWEMFYARIASLMPKPRIYHDLYPESPWMT
jgi:RNA-directed DNA polymerase